jgi:WD40 repeat protein
MDDCVRIFSLNSLVQSSRSKDVDSSFLAMENNSTLTSELEEHPDGANCVAWNQSGSKLLSCGEDHTIKAFSVLSEEGLLIRTLTPHSAAVTGIDFHPPTGNFVTASEDGSVCVFDSDTYRQLKKWEIPGSRFWCCW